MSSSEDMLRRFDQNDYAYTFYECDKEHPFIAFTTCYCPLCDTMATIKDTGEELDTVERALDNCMESYEDLVVKVSNHSPELLI